MTDALRRIRGLRDSDYWGAAARVGLLQMNSSPLWDLKPLKRESLREVFMGLAGPRLSLQPGALNQAL